MQARNETIFSIHLRFSKEGKFGCTLQGIDSMLLYGQTAGVISPFHI
jgi:hypothetical protein